MRTCFSKNARATSVAVCLCAFAFVLGAKMPSQCFACQGSGQHRVTVEGEKIVGGIVWTHWITATFSSEFCPPSGDPESEDDWDSDEIDWEDVYSADFVESEQFPQNDFVGYFAGGGLGCAAVVAGGQHGTLDAKYALFQSNALQSLLDALVQQLLGAI